MRKLLLAAVAMVPLAAVSQPAEAQRAGDRIAGSYICVFNKNAVSRSNTQSEARRTAQGLGGQLTHIYYSAVRGFSINLSEQAIARIKSVNPRVAYCEQDKIVTIGPMIGAQARSGGGAQPPQEKPWGIGRVGGGGAGTFATAWIIDTGLTFGHPDLNTDQGRSKSFLIRDTSPVDQNGHGTHVGGTIGALDNAIGVIGVAPGATLVAVRVLDRRGSGTVSGVIAGIDYVAQAGHAGDVANMSLGGGISQALDNAVVSAASGGVRFALAAGNESDNANNHSPGRANGTNVYTVSAFSSGDKWASFSNFGNPPIDYAEPGVSVKSTWLNGGYNTISGTSMATPHLAGLLLAGSVRNGGTVKGDPDGRPDVIGVH